MTERPIPDIHQTLETMLGSARKVFRGLDRRTTSPLTGSSSFSGVCPLSHHLEDHDGMNEREEFMTSVQTVVRDAEVAVHNGDAAPRRAIWSRNDPVTVLGAWKNASGQAELDELFAYLGESFSNCTAYEFELLGAEVLGDAAYTVGFEHTSASVNGVPRTY